jgi:hypothetical protein
MVDEKKDPLIHICNLLNQQQAQYFIVGGHACILHGLVRTTEDVDILIIESKETYRDRDQADLTHLKSYFKKQKNKSFCQPTWRTPSFSG